MDEAHKAMQGYKPGELEGDLEFLMRAAQKINAIREDLGKVGLVIAAQVEEAMLGQRTTLDTTLAERESEPLRRLLKFERKVQDQITKLKEKLDQTRQDQSNHSGGCDSGRTVSALKSVGTEPIFASGDP